MEEIQIQLKIILSNKNIEDLTFYYTYVPNSKFNNLIDYISSFSKTKICPCYTFYFDKFKIGIDEELNILKKFIKKRLISSNKIDLFLINKTKECSEKEMHKFFSLSKKEILNEFEREKATFNPYNTELERLKKENKELNDAIKKLKKTNKKNENEFNEEYNKNISQIKELSNSIKELKESEKKLKEENLKVKNELYDEKKKNESAEKDIKVLKYAVKGDFATMNKLKEEGLDKNLKPKNILKIDTKTNKIKGNKNEYIRENGEVIFENFYDIVIDIKSVKDINKGWKIKMSDKGKNNYEKYKKEKVLKIGVIGNANKGKSYILSRISKIDFPSGTSIRTEGLSIKYPELERFKDRNIALLDSAGLETPVLREKDDNKKTIKKSTQETKKESTQETNKEELNKELLFREKSREKIITELFLQNYIIYNSDILILVVGILTYSEQKLLNRIKTEIKKMKINKPLYIIHNLITFIDINEVKTYIEKYLMESATFKLVEGHKVSTELDSTEGIYYHEENSKIFHLIFANEDSDAGKYYNNFTLNFLENSYQQQVTDIKEFDVIETIKERFTEISKEIIEKTDKMQQITTNDLIEENNCLKLKTNQEITLKKCLIDELGFSNLKGNGFDPYYNYYKKNDNLMIRVEAPGNCDIKPTIIYSGEYTVINLTGEKKKDKEPEKLEDNIHNTREFGNYYLDIPLKTEEYLISNEDPKIIERKGVFMIQYKLDQKKESNKYELKEEDEI